MKPYSRKKEIFSIDFVTTARKYGTSCHIYLPTQWNGKKVFVSAKVIDNATYDMLVNANAQVRHKQEDD